MSVPPSSSTTPPLEQLSDFDAKEAHKAQVIARVRRQRDAWQATRAPSASAQAATAAAAAGIAAGVDAAGVDAAAKADAGVAGAAAGASAAADLPPRGPVVFASANDRFPRSMTMKLVTRHPGLAVGLVAVALAIGPSRLVRTASMLLPTLLRRF